MKKYRTDFSKEELHAALHANDDKAMSIIEDEDKWTEFKEKFDAFLKKAEKIPVLGGVIDDIVCMVALVDSYVRKEYREIPFGTIISIIGALIYVLSPIDFVPDFIPVIGYLDDVAVVMLILGFGVDKDLDKYRQWHEENRKKALISFEGLLAEEMAVVIGHMYLSAVVVGDDNRIKLLLSEDQETTTPADCIVRAINIPQKALEEYDVTDIIEIVDIISETVLQDSVHWVSEVDKKAYYEPDFDDRWDNYIIREEE